MARRTSLRYLLDTCFVSDLEKAVVPPGVAAWSESHSATECAISVLTVGELRFGIQLSADGHRRTKLEEWITRDVLTPFADRMLDVTLDIAETWATLSVRARDARRRLPAADGLILATAAVHHLTVVTRNVRDFEGYGVAILNPWEPRPLE